MISAMMVMTTSSSTSVKPRSSRARCRHCDRVATRRMRLPDDLTDREERGHHRHDQSADDDADHDDRRRPRDADDAIEAALQLCFVELSDAPGEHRKLTRLLAQA